MIQNTEILHLIEILRNNRVDVVKGDKRQCPPLVILQTRKLTRIMIAISPRVRDSIAYTLYAIQACLLTGRTAHITYSLFHII